MIAWAILAATWAYLANRVVNKKGAVAIFWFCFLMIIAYTVRDWLP